MKKGTKFKHLTWHDRLLIEKLVNKGYHKAEIADIIGCSLKTIYNELKRAEYEHTRYDWSTETRYSPDIAHERYRNNLKKKGAVPKLKKDIKLCNYIEELIVKLKYSPEAIILYMKQQGINFDVNISSANTIYSGIRKGYFKKVTMELLPRKGRRTQRKKRVKIQKQASKGKSIEKRSEGINKREFFGHWEMDCVVGKVTNNKTLLVMTERKTRYEIIEQLKTHTTYEVIKALNRLEKKFGSDFYKIFKSITVDNGSEFKDNHGMEKALYKKSARTEIYYCHAHAPHERGSNENQNILIRRFYPKGSDFDETVTRTNIKDVEFWVNTYPRRMFKGKCSMDYFIDEIDNLGCKRNIIDLI